MIGFNSNDGIVRAQEVGVWAYTMISQYLGGAPNSIVFFGANLIITIIWNSENGRALRGAIYTLGEAVEEREYTIMRWLRTWLCQTQL